MMKYELPPHPQHVGLLQPISCHAGEGDDLPPGEGGPLENLETRRVEAALPAALAHEAARKAAGEPLPLRDHDAERKADESSFIDLQRSHLIAPLILGNLDA